MALPQTIRARLTLPIVAAPMFLVSGPQLVSAACQAGIIGSFPFPNARDIAQLDAWLDQLSSEQANAQHIAPYAVNLTTHKTYDRLADEITLIKAHRPPIVITALGSPAPVMEAVKSYGGRVIADVNSVKLARRAVEAGVDGLALICAGAGGHTGAMSTYAFVEEVRGFFDGLVILAGSICSGRAVYASQIMGADLCYVGTSFIATQESLANETYRRYLCEASFEDLIESDALTGAKALYLRACLERMGVLQAGEVHSARKPIDFSNAQQQIKAWRDIWSAGHGVGMVTKIQPVAQIVQQFASEYRRAVEAARTIDFPSLQDVQEGSHVR